MYNVDLFNLFISGYAVGPKTVPKINEGKMYIGLELMHNIYIKQNGCIVGECLPETTVLILNYFNSKQTLWTYK